MRESDNYLLLDLFNPEIIKRTIESRGQPWHPLLRNIKLSEPLPLPSNALSVAAGSPLPSRPLAFVLNWVSGITTVVQPLVLHGPCRLPSRVQTAQDKSMNNPSRYKTMLRSTAFSNSFQT